jgi:hypothetical protein
MLLLGPATAEARRGPGVLPQRQVRAIQRGVQRYRDLRQRARGRHQPQEGAQYANQRVYKLTTPLFRRQLSAEAAITRLRRGKLVRAVPLKVERRVHEREGLWVGDSHWLTLRRPGSWSTLKLRRNGRALKTSDPGQLAKWLHAATPQE